MVLNFNVAELCSISALPADLLKIFLTAADLLVHRASWHKSCHLKYGISKLTRVRKSKANCNEPDFTACQLLRLLHWMTMQKKFSFFTSGCN